jgi:hypothetical protein
VRHHGFSRSSLYKVTSEQAPRNLLIENEQCNVQKNHGYELEHNYGHGQQTLSMVFSLLNLLALVAHVILERGDRLYQRCLATTSRRELWHTFRTTMRMLLEH